MLSRRPQRAGEGEVLQAGRDQEIGRLKMELEWLKQPVAPCPHGHTRDA